MMKWSAIIYPILFILVSISAHSAAISLTDSEYKIDITDAKSEPIIEYKDGILSVESVDIKDATIQLPRTATSRISLNPILLIRENLSCGEPEFLQYTEENTISVCKDKVCKDVIVMTTYNVSNKMRCFEKAVPYTKNSKTFNRVDISDGYYKFNVEHFTDYIVNVTGTFLLTDCLFAINNTAGNTCTINTDGFYPVNDSYKFSITTITNGVIHIDSRNVSIDFNGSTIHTDETDYNYIVIYVDYLALGGGIANLTIENLNASYPLALQSGLRGVGWTSGSGMIKIHNVTGANTLFSGTNITDIEIINSVGGVSSATCDIAGGCDMGNIFISNLSGSLDGRNKNVSAQGMSNGIFTCKSNCTLINSWNISGMTIADSTNTATNLIRNVSVTGALDSSSTPNLYLKNTTINGTLKLSSNTLVEELNQYKTDAVDICISIGGADNLTISNSTISCTGYTTISSASSNLTIKNSTIDGSEGYNCLLLTTDAKKTNMINNSFHDCGSDKYAVYDKHGFYMGDTTYSYGGNDFDQTTPTIYRSDLGAVTQIDVNDKNVSGAIVTGNENFTLCLFDIPLAGAPFLTAYIEQPISTVYGNDCPTIATNVGGTSYLEVPDFLGYNTATSNYSINTSVTGLTIHSGADPAYLRYAEEYHEVQATFGIDNVGTDINFTGNTFYPNSIDSLWFINEHGSNNKYWFNNFYYRGINDTGTGTDYCIENEGNFYQEGITPIAGDCGPLNITANSTTKLTISTTWWKGQSSQNNLVYHYMADGIYQGTAGVNQSVVVPIYTDNITFYANDGAYNSTHISVNIKPAYLQGIILLYQQGKIILRDGLLILN